MPEAPRIHLLSDAVANKIAAGEVVERPASVLKELLENAVDAGASRIQVEITAGGRKLVSVADNGCGMGREDALLSIESHATSKIRDVDDIEHIHTLGFRGEALAAIASVSRFRLVTCPTDASEGTELLAAAGRITDVRDMGAPPGTLMEVRDLFFNVPARRKFLRSYPTEAAHLRSCFILEALAHADLAMSFSVDGLKLYQLAAGGTLTDRIRDLFGGEYLKNLRPFTYAAGPLAAEGFLSQPGFSRADRNDQYIFVNGRPTSAAIINFAIREGYRGLLPKERHPIAFIRITVAPDAVDVNVHPTKREVRFRQPNDLRDGLIAAIRTASGQSGPISLPPVGNEVFRASLEPQPPPLRAEQLTIENLPHAPAFRYPRLPPPDSAPTATPPPAAGPRADASVPIPTTATTTPGPGLLETAPWAWCRVVGLVGGNYVVLETDEGFILMDPRGAHERVLFERYLQQVRKGEVQSQNLLIPENVELGPKDAACIRKHHELLRRIGFGIAEFGGNAFVVDALPACFAEAQATNVLTEMAAMLTADGGRGASERWREESIARAGSQVALRHRDRLKLEEIEQLVLDLARTEMPYTSPQGRPTLIFTSFQELSRRFGRA